MENPAASVTYGSAARASIQAARTPQQEAQQYVELIQNQAG